MECIKVLGIVSFVWMVFLILPFPNNKINFNNKKQVFWIWLVIFILIVSIYFIIFAPNWKLMAKSSGLIVAYNIILRKFGDYFVTIDNPSEKNEFIPKFIIIPTNSEGITIEKRNVGVLRCIEVIK